MEVSGRTGCKSGFHRLVFGPGDCLKKRAAILAEHRFAFGRHAGLVQTVRMSNPSAGVTTADLQQAISELFPAGIAVCYSSRCPADADLLLPEREHTQSMVSHRLEEFRHGRWCARQAMQQLGLPPAAIGKRPDRSPQWPAGITGTIAHTGAMAAAAIARAENYVSLGLDIEQAGPLEAEAARLIVRPDEDGGVHGNRARVLFSIKEAIYKCIHPVVRTYVDFQGNACGPERPARPISVPCR